MSRIGRDVRFTVVAGREDDLRAAAAAIRVAPTTAPAVPAGSDGLELLVFGLATPATGSRWTDRSRSVDERLHDEL